MVRQKRTVALYHLSLLLLIWAAVTTNALDDILDVLTRSISFLETFHPWENASVE